MVAQVHPDCINSNNPYHECTEYCLLKINERKSFRGSAAAPAPPHDAFADLPKEFGKKQRQVQKRNPNGEARGAVDPVQHSSEEEEEPPARPNVFARKVDDSKRQRKGEEAEEKGDGGGEARGGGSDGGGREGSLLGVEGPPGNEGRWGGGAGEGGDDGSNDAPAYENMSEREKKLFELRLKMNQARKLNQGAVVAEARREKASAEPQETRGMSKAKWYEEKQKRMGKVLEANGLDMSTSYMLDTQQAAEEKYKKQKKKEAAFGWDVFNQKSLYTAYKKRAANVPVDMEEYERQKESDPDFYRDSTCLEYGKAPEIPEENVDRMVAELQARGQNRKEFSRRRRHHDEKDIDAINERNEHFNRKIERAFGKYTVEIKNNLERGTALPD